MHAAGVSELRRRNLAPEKDVFGEEFGSDVGGFEDGILSGGRGTWFDGAYVPEREGQKQEQQAD